MTYAPPPATVAASSMRQTMTLLVSLCVVVGIAMLALAGIVYSYAYIGVPSGDPLPQGGVDMQRVWAPVIWNIGMLFLIVGILGTAVYRKTEDPLSRLLVWLVALVLALLLVTMPSVFFTLP